MVRRDRAALARAMLRRRCRSRSPSSRAKKASAKTLDTNSLAAVRTMQRRAANAAAAIGGVTARSRRDVGAPYRRPQPSNCAAPPPSASCGQAGWGRGRIQRRPAQRANGRRTSPHRACLGGLLPDGYPRDRARRQCPSAIAWSWKRLGSRSASTPAATVYDLAMQIGW